MSISNQQQQQDTPTQQVIECDLRGCERAGRPWTFQSGCCTREHWHKHRGRKALSSLKFDHTRCFSCQASLKEIDPPKPDMAFRESGVGFTYNADEDRIEVLRYAQETTRQAACGYQHTLPASTIGQKDVRRKTVTGVVCGNCGSADHRQHIAFIADGHRTAAAVADYLDEECDDEFDAETLHREYAATDDIELAAGAAIIECRD